VIRPRFVFVALFALVSAVRPSAAVAAPVASQIRFTANLGAPGQAELAAIVLTDGASDEHGSTVLLVPGLAQTARTLVDLAAALFRPEFGHQVSRVIVIDLPGHGASGLPTLAPFGTLLIDDYVTALIATLDHIQALGMSTDVMIGHSLGAEVVQLAQQRLITAGTSLRERYGIGGVMLMSPVLPSPLPWAFADSGAAAAVLGSFVRFDASLGPIVDFPPLAWAFLFAVDKQGTVPARAPSGADAAANGFISLDSFFVGAQLIGLTGPRPAVNEGVFADAQGTVLGIVSLEQDAFFTFPDEHRALYAFLTGDAHEKFFFPIAGADTVHNLHTFDVEPFLHPIKKVLNAIVPR
jgi:pimeloyl-ACP methyl ester carboxylesterase